MTNTFVTYKATSELRANPRNARVHPRRQIEMLAAAIREFGWTMPILIDENGILLAGHARLDAAAMIYSDGGSIALANKTPLPVNSVPVIDAVGWSETQKKAYVEADNRLSEIGGWDDDLRRQELEALRALGVAMDSLGWDEKALDEYLKVGTVKEKDPDAVPEIPPASYVRAGDVWHLDTHRIVCGDSTAEDVWRALFQGEHARAVMVFTDPPYGVSYESASGKFEVIEGDHKRRDELFKMLTMAFRMMAKFSEEAVAFYIWHASTTRTDFSQAISSAGLVERQYLIWAKPHAVMGRSDYHWTHEPCFYASKQQRAPRFYGDHTQTTVWRLSTTQGAETATVIGPGVLVLDGHGNSLYIQQRPPKSKKPREVRIQEEGSLVLVNESGLGTVWEVKRDRNYEHPTQKPVELATRAIENSSQRDDIVVDGFAGSGTTIIGAEMTGRRCFCIELDPVYAAVCIERWQTYSGKIARLNGVPYTEVVKDRKKEAEDAAGNSGKSVPGGKRSKGIDRTVAEPQVREEVPPAQS